MAAIVPTVAPNEHAVFPRLGPVDRGYAEQDAGVGVIVLFVQNLAVISLRPASSKAFRLRVRYAKLDVASH
jgi:hypothetical protein